MTVFLMIFWHPTRHKVVTMWSVQILVPVLARLLVCVKGENKVIIVRKTIFSMIF